MIVLLRCPNCQGMKPLNKWVNCTAKTLNVDIFAAVKNSVYICPQCKNASPKADIPRINH